MAYDCAWSNLLFSVVVCLGKYDGYCSWGVKILAREPQANIFPLEQYPIRIRVDCFWLDKTFASRLHCLSPPSKMSPPWLVILLHLVTPLPHWTWKFDKRRSDLQLPMIKLHVWLSIGYFSRNIWQSKTSDNLEANRPRRHHYTGVKNSILNALCRGDRTIVEF